jgi:hypothetical protein
MAAIECSLPALIRFRRQRSIHISPPSGYLWAADVKSIHPLLPSG